MMDRLRELVERWLRAADEARGTEEDARMAYEDCADELEAARPRWIPVTERLPEQHVMVLTWDGQSRCIDEYLGDGTWGSDRMRHMLFDPDTEDAATSPLAWQPLHSPPEDK